MTDTITVRRGTKPSWTFLLTTHGNYDCQQRKALYRLMWGHPQTGKPIWIAKIVDGGLTAVTAESEIGATSVQFAFGDYYFHKV